MTDEELTRLAATKIMGWELCRMDSNWHPLTDWWDAGNIVEKMRADGWLIILHWAGDFWNARFFRHEDCAPADNPREQRDAFVNSRLLTVAITVAALLSVGAMTEEPSLTHAWPRLNRERCLLIDKSIAGTITAEERVRLEALQAMAAERIEQFERYRDPLLDRLERRLGDAASNPLEIGGGE